ncbi:MAG: LysR family transcriptional regulator [Rhodobacteraceae bacterium]|nr:LysR family transcriptional regulator [Paracoccaceae bacterium]
MNIGAIETYLVIAELGGFHIAARRLNITQTAVSARIKSLEKALLHGSVSKC